MTTRVALTLGLATFVLACTDEASEAGDEGVEATDTGESESGDSSEGDTTSEGETTSETTSETETGPLEPDLEQACADVCATVEACGMGVPQCQEICVSGHAEFEGECLDAEVAMTLCMTELSCPDLQALLQSVPGEPGTPCEEQGAALCGIGCEVIAIPEDPSGCSVELTCGDLPLHTVECGDETCFCSIEGTAVSACPVDLAVCDMDVAAVDACCGWNLSEA